MTDLKLIPVNSGDIQTGYDISLTSGRFDLVDGINEIGNRIIFNLQVYAQSSKGDGENYTNQSFGVNYLDNVFGRSVTDPVMIDTFKAAILNTRGVTDIKTFDIELDSNRIAILTSQVTTTEGELLIVTPIQT